MAGRFNSSFVNARGPTRAHAFSRSFPRLFVDLASQLLERARADDKTAWIRCSGTTSCEQLLPERRSRALPHQGVRPRPLKRACGVHLNLVSSAACKGPRALFSWEKRPDLAGRWRTLLVCVITTLASLYPAFRAARVDPVSSLRHE
jgi:hypothetical protein